MRKGSEDSQVLTILSNAGSSGDPYTITLKDTGYSAGTKLIDMYSCNGVTVDADGSIAVEVTSGLPQVLMPAFYAGDALCGSTPRPRPHRHQWHA